MLADSLLSLLIISATLAVEGLGALRGIGSEHARQIVLDVSETQLPPPSTIYYFDQLIDHNNPGLGTFKQRYWHNWEFYQQGESLHLPLCGRSINMCAGGPIVLAARGESNAMEGGRQRYVRR